MHRNFPIRSSSNAYRDCRQNLWPTEVSLRKLSDINNCLVKNGSKVSSESTASIYNISVVFEQNTSTVESSEDIDEEMPWMREMKRLTVNPEPLSPSHLQKLYHQKGEHFNLAEYHFNQLKDKKVRFQGDESMVASDNEVDNSDSDSAFDVAKSSVNNKTKLLLDRSRVLTESLRQNRPTTPQGSPRTSSTKSFEKMSRHRNDHIDTTIGKPNSDEQKKKSESTRSYTPITRAASKATNDNDNCTPSNITKMVSSPKRKKVVTKKILVRAVAT